MLPILMKNTEELANMRMEAEKLGGVMDEDLVKSSLDLERSVFRVQTIYKSFGARIAKEIIPTVRQLADRIGDLLLQEKGIAQVGMNRTIDILGHAMRFAVSDVGKFTIAITGLASAIGIAKNAGSLVNALSAINPGMITMAGSLLSAGKAAAAFALPIIVLGLVLEDLYVGAIGGQSVIVDLADAFGYGEEMSDRLKGSLALLNDGLDVIAITGERVVEAFDYIGRNSAYAYDEVSKFFDGLMAKYAMIKKIYDMIEFISRPGRALLGAATNPIGTTWDQMTPERMAKADSGFDKFTRWARGDSSIVFGRDRSADGGPVDFGASQREYYGAQGMTPLGPQMESLATPLTREEAARASKPPKVEFNLTVNASDKRAIMDEINRFGESSLDELDTLR
jgi:hypothetical protein